MGCFVSKTVIELFFILLRSTVSPPKNPFNSSTEISFSVQNKTFIQLTIYDITGNKIIDLVQKNYQPGQYKVRWNGLNQNGNEVSSGMYIYTMISNQNKSSLPMILIK